ncbi:hypothetical protein BCV71DRAFT_254279 [Rhizopus microsporus]|uniref:Uncharacterized protein n=1 Tax=Rhizopus microsporus TaxID=58291 RepID=A0A1X0S889_RHIZD|nr:hypothetical protein BCV71DRAFT_254279 [Rhizopus microsporus]
MPLVIFDNGLKNKSHVKFKRLRQGVSERVYRQLRLREKLGGLIFLDIDEHKTSKKISNVTMVINTRSTKYPSAKIAMFIGIEASWPRKICLPMLNDNDCRISGETTV